jgi:PAS domain S-box-containing protein
MMCVSSADGYFKRVNAAFTATLGWDRDELLARPYLDFVHPEDLEPTLAAVEHQVKGGKKIFCFENRYRHKDGSWRVLSWRSVPYPGGFMYATARDVTEVRRVEEALRFSEERLGTLAGGVAHDLNNALAPILMGMEILKDEYPQESELLETIAASARRGADMVRQLMTYAKGAEGDHVLVEIDPLMREMQKIIRGTFPKSIRIEVLCDPQLPNVRGDATQIHQILLNLAINARDAMPDGGTLTLEARGEELDELSATAHGLRAAKPGRYAVLRVRDTGTGIPPELVDRIFDPFFTTKSPEVGTGLGLSTVLGIVKGHRGFLSVDTRIGQGTTFNVFFPADGGNDAAAQSQ